MQSATRPMFALASAVLLSACAGASGSMSTAAPSDRAAKNTASIAPAMATPKTDVQGSANVPRDPDPTPESVAVAGSELVRGRATVTVNAPIDKVREAVLSFGHYAEFMPHYETSKVLGRTPDGARQVYMGIEALHGAVHMWAQVEVPKPTIAAGVETYETMFDKGNVDDFKAIWRLKKIDPASTELSLEVFLKPSIRLPVQIVNNENLKGAVKGVVAMKARAEGKAPPEEL